MYIFYVITNFVMECACIKNGYISSGLSHVNVPPDAVIAHARGQKVHAHEIETRLDYTGAAGAGRVHNGSSYYVGCI